MTSALLLIPGLLHRAIRGGIAGCQRLVDRHLAGNRAGDALTDYGAERLKFRNPDELYARVWHRLESRVFGVSRLDGLEHEVAERRGLLVLGASIRRLARSRRHRGPALILRDQFDVVLRRGPRNELLRRLDLLGRFRNRQRPGPQPVRTL